MVRAFLCNWMFMVGDCYTQSVMMPDLSNTVAPRFSFLPAPQFPPRPAGVRPLSLAIEDSSSSVYNHTGLDNAGWLPFVPRNDVNFIALDNTLEMRCRLVFDTAFSELKGHRLHIIFVEV